MSMKVMVIPIKVVALWTISKGLSKGLEEDLQIRGQVEAIQTTALVNRPEYWEESRRLEETCCYSVSSEKQSANAGVKNSQRSKIILRK